MVVGQRISKDTRISYKTNEEKRNFYINYVLFSRTFRIFLLFITLVKEFIISQACYYDKMEWKYDKQIKK